MKSILIVDDDIEFLNIISSILPKQQFQIYRATGIQEALKLLEYNTVDAICSDYNICDGTGLELLIKFRQQNVTTPFMIM